MGVTVTVTIQADNDSFEGFSFAPEIQRILKKAGERIAYHSKQPFVIALYDTNGNNVGTLDVTVTDEADDYTFRDLVARMKEEINSDIASGIVPASVGTFAELHDYVDANEYGGATEDGSPLQSATLHNRCTNAVDAWLRAGRS
jgi:hypothetical protein